MLLVIQKELFLCSSGIERQREKEKVEKLLHLTACLILAFPSAPLLSHHVFLPFLPLQYWA